MLATSSSSSKHRQAPLLTCATLRLAAAPAASKRVSILEGKRAYIFSIELAQFRMGFDELTDLVLELDPLGRLTLEQIEQLLKLMPTEEESVRIAQLEAELLGRTTPDGLTSELLSNADLEGLGRTEQFLLTVGRIPRLAHRSC